MLPYKILVNCFFFVFITINAWANEPKPGKFTVYAYVPWRTSSSQEVSDILYTYGIQPIVIIYEDRYFTNGEIDNLKIKNQALINSKKNIPVSFDMEFGNRFKPDTIVPKIKAILKQYRLYHPNAFLGIYAIIPQNTYGFRPVNAAYSQLNEQYVTIEKEIDYISPSLYNYTGRDFDTWYENAKFNIEVAKKYGGSAKPLIPYISPIIRKGTYSQVKKGNLVEELTEEEMTKRLDTLYKLEASGCIIWASSQDRTADGEFPQFNPNKGWGKAVIQYIKTH